MKITIARQVVGLRPNISDRPSLVLRTDNEHICVTLKQYVVYPIVKTIFEVYDRIDSKTLHLWTDTEDKKRYRIEKVFRRCIINSGIELEDDITTIDQLTEVCKSVASTYYTLNPQLPIEISNEKKV